MYSVKLYVLIDYELPDVSGGTESWLNDDVTTSEIFPPNYQVNRRGRSSDTHGRVLITV